MSRNLLKAGWVTFGEDTRVINSNEVIELRLREEAGRSVPKQIKESVQEDGFTEGLGAENVDALFETDSGNTVPKSISKEEQERLEREVKAAKEELERLKAEASQLMDRAEAEISAMKAKAYEDAQKRGYQEGFTQGMAQLEEEQNRCKEETAAMKQAYQQKMDELEPEIVKTLTEIYEHIFKVDLRKYESLVYQLLTDALLKINGTKNMIIHVSKEDYSSLQEQKQAILEETGMMGNAVEFISDATLMKAQCMIETDHGVYDCSLDTELEELKRRLSLLAFH